ncbi:MAG: carbon-nitrogen hydrolase family protein [Clostridia bacterium]|nr:carbon-nitrogen hydrolase family protein [Clostridia bacterium]
MSNFVTLSTIGALAPDFSSVPKNFTIYEKEMKTRLKNQIEAVLPDKPDLIVFPECANNYYSNTKEDLKEELKEYCKYLKNSFVDFLKPFAIENNVNIAYGAMRYVGSPNEKPYRNSIVYIDRNGEVRGNYDKNHTMTGEFVESDINYGTDAKLVELDFGKVASAICFDLNFDELLYRYKSQKPDLIVFSSSYHGGLNRLAQWAYTCRSYLISSVNGMPCMPCYIMNPYGDVIASSTNYTDHASATVNLDYEICHIDFNWEKIKAAKNKYKDALTVYDPGFVGSVLLACNISDITISDILSEFEIISLDDYLECERAHRLANI